ncbi:MAG: LysE family translocator [Alphaproteobacteria bacterium]|nr:LysE family translocator [Alphaproteobacteria bacterium]
MEYVLPLTGVVLAHLLATISPGPSFILVSRIGMTRSRRHGLLAACGMGIGAAIWATAALFGLAAVLEQHGEIHALLRLGGALFLGILAISLWRGASRPQPPVVANPPGSADLMQAFRTALLVQLTNPKVMVFFGSIFVSLLPQGLPAWMSAAVITLILVNETAWYAIVATAFSTAGPRLVYQRVRAPLDRVLAGVFAALAVKLVLDRT